MWYLNGLLSGILLSIAAVAFVFRYPRRLKWLGSVISRFAEALEPSVESPEQAETAGKSKRAGKPIVAQKPQLLQDLESALVNQGMKLAGPNGAEALASWTWNAVLPQNRTIEVLFREALKYRRTA